MQMTGHLPLSALRAFEVAARLGSFTKAGDELAMTQAAVSYQVKKLETFLGVVLFTRSGRHIRLTTVGEQLSQSLSDVFTALRAACVTAATQNNVRLAITALPTVASHWLVPRLGDFQSRHPEYRVQLDASVSAIDLRVSEFDVAIRTGSGKWPGCEAAPLFPNNYTVLCAPDLCASSSLRQPRDLLGLPLFGRVDWWRAWFKAAGLEDAELSHLKVTDLSTQPMEVTAALSQGGAAIVTPAFFSGEVASGRLAIPFDLTASQESQYWLVYKKGAGGLPNVRDFRNWAVSQAAEVARRWGS